MHGLNQDAYLAERLTENYERQKLPVRGVINRVVPAYDSVEIDMALNPGTARIKVRHPYFGVNSWIRVMPDVGTNVLTQQRGDGVENELAYYVSSNSAERVRQFKRNEGLFRPMDEGEIDIMSSGRAYIHLGSGGDVEMRGGSVRQELLQTRLEINAMAPTFIRALHRASPDQLKYQERFGVIKRPDQNFPNTLETYVKDSAGEFQYEYVRTLHDKDQKPLVELQEGIVVDETGQAVQQGSTNKTLRHLKRFSNLASGDALTTEIDEDLNVLITNSANVAKETKITLGVQNVLTLSCKDTKFNVIKTGTEQYGTSFTATAPTMTYNASTSYTIRTAKAHLNSSLVQFGANPVIPVALAGPTVALMTTALGAIQAAMSIMGADPAFITAAPVSAAAAQTSGVTLAAALSSGPQSIPSTQVFASG